MAMTILPAAFVLALVAITTLSYDHRGRKYAIDKIRAIQSPEHFRLVAILLQLSVAIVAPATLITHHPLLEHWSPPVWFMCAALGVAALGVGLFVWSKRTLGQSYSPCFDSFVPQQLVANGPYRYVRHPIYLANVITIGSIAMATGSGWIAIGGIMLTVYYTRSARAEESALVELLPGYADYCERTGRLVPRILHAG